MLLLLSVIWDFNIFTQSYIITGFPGNQNEYNLSLYLYDKAFVGFPPIYGLGGAHRADFRADPARGHGRLRAHLGPAGGPDMTAPDRTRGEQRTAMPPHRTRAPRQQRAGPGRPASTRSGC